MYACFSLCVGAQWTQCLISKKRVSDILDFEAKKVANNLIWTLGAEFGSSARLLSNLNYWVIALALNNF